MQEVNSGGSGRFRIISEPVASPGKCGVCGTADSGSRESFMDLGLTFEYYGVLYLCNECVLAIAHEYGYVTPAESATKDERIVALGNELVQVKSRLAASEAYIASVFSVEPGSLVPSGDTSDSNVVDDSIIEDGISGTEKDDSGSAELADESGSSNLRYPDGSAVGTLSL